MIKQLIGMLTDLADVLVEKETVELSPEAQQRISRFTKEKRCLYCGDPLGDEKPKPQRGVHNSCYHKMRGEDRTFISFMKMGMIGPKSQPGRKARRTAFVDPTSQTTKKEGAKSVGRVAKGKTER